MPIVDGLSDCSVLRRTDGMSSRPESYGYCRIVHVIAVQFL